MTNTSHESFRSRRVVTGLDEQGRSTIVFDGLSDTRTVGPGWALNDIWQVDAVPPRASDDHTLLPGETVFAPSVGGIVWRMAMLPPDSTWQPAVDRDEPVGMHATETLDIVTILSGEVYAVLEDCETLLRSGDTIVQRGTVHTWSNRSDEPCVSVSAIIPLTA
jgi:hypothetical protein